MSDMPTDYGCQNFRKCYSDAQNEEGTSLLEGEI